MLSHLIWKSLCAHLAVAGIIMGVLGTTSSVLAAPVLFPGTMSYYEMVPTKLTWAQAKAAAAARTFSGIQGRLATVTSAGENGFIVNSVLPNINDGDSYWLGATQPTGSPEPAGGWQWITGEPFTYTNWRTSTGEPNNTNLGGGFENCLEIFNALENGTWNDLYDGNSLLSEGYVVEYPSGVPEPASLALLTGLAVGAMRRRSHSMGT